MRRGRKTKQHPGPCRPSQGPPLAENLRRFLTERPLLPFTPQRSALSLITTGSRSCVATRGWLSLQGDWLWLWKDHIDRTFMARYSTGLPDMSTSSAGSGGSGGGSSDGGGGGAVGSGRGSGGKRGTDGVAGGAEGLALLAASKMRCGGCGGKVRRLGIARSQEPDMLLLAARVMQFQQQAPDPRVHTSAHSDCW